MGTARRAAPRTGWLERASSAALAVVAVAALLVAVRIGAAAGLRSQDLLAELRAAAERRVAAERVQILTALEAAERGDARRAREEAETVLARLDGNSQLHLLLAGLYRDDGALAPALREYRRAVELVRDYTDRNSPLFIGAWLGPWLQQRQPALSGAPLADLRYLQRALAGGCS